MPDSISLIFLAHNEALTIEKEIKLFYKEIIQKLPGSEFIIAEDGSTDGTTQIIQKLVKELGIIHLTSKERKGYARALKDAVLFAKNNYIFFSDTGLKNDPKDFWKLYENKEKFDLIVGRKLNRKDQFYRKILTNSYNFFIRKYFGFKNIYDSDSGFRLFNKKVVEKVFKKDLFFKNLIGSEIVLRAVLQDLKYCEIPINYFQRQGISRGMPVKKIPKIILGSFSNLAKLKREFRELSNAK
ncbi:glycosyltransferase family 2 protein [Candidatus Babeliales bacterium]|nr:glycosyltransferase family 2 protein [Candidatus Babeliales bacterium]